MLNSPTLNQNPIKINRALVSVFDKTGVVELAQSLKNLGVEILSTGGTAKVLRDANISVTDVSDYTKFPEIMDGRVKTINPLIEGGILGLRDKHSADTLEKKAKATAWLAQTIAKRTTETTRLSKDLEKVEKQKITVNRQMAAHLGEIAKVRLSLATEKEDLAAVLQKKALVA